MKKLFTFFALAIFTFTSCSDDGEMGPRGPQGPPGPPGESLSYTFEETVTFDYYSDDNFYSAFIFIGEEIETVNPAADAVLVYRLEVVEDNDGGDLDSWSLIPQNFFTDEGTIQYVYRHTVGDVEIFIEGDYDLTDLNSDYTDNQTFRVVVVPSDYAQATNEDISSYKALMNTLKKDGIQVLNMDIEQ